MISLFQYSRIVAAFLVLLIHQHFLPSIPFLDSLKGCAVPLFACIAGYLYRGGGKVRRILFPYCVRAVIYFVANNVVLDVFIRRQQFVIPPLTTWLLGGTACHLWFLPSLFGAFLLASLPCRFGMASTSRCRWLWGCVLLCFGVATQFLLSLGGSETFYGYVRIYFGRLLLYFALGFVLRPVLESRLLRGSMSKVILGGCCSALGIVNLVFGFLSGLSWRPLFFVVGMVILSVGCGNFWIPNVIDRMAKNTMGIYLVHVLFTSAANVLLARLGLGQLPVLLGIPLTLALFLASYFCALLLPKWMKG